MNEITITLEQPESTLEARSVQIKMDQYAGAEKTVEVFRSLMFCMGFGYETVREYMPNQDEIENMLLEATETPDLSDLFTD